MILPCPPVHLEGVILRPRVIKEAVESKDKDKTNENKTANRLQKELFNIQIQDMSRSTEILASSVAANCEYVLCFLL